MELNDENTNNNLRLPPTFAYLMISKEDNTIELEIDETRIIYGIMVRDIMSLVFLMSLSGINPFAQKAKS